MGEIVGFALPEDGGVVFKGLDTGKLGPLGYDMKEADGPR